MAGKSKPARAISRAKHVGSPRKSGSPVKGTATKTPGPIYVKSYISQASRDNGNWAWQLSSFSEDSEIRLYQRELRRRSRTLWRVNPYVGKYFQALDSNVIGADGYQLQMQCKEEADRVIAVPGDKTAERQGEAELYERLERELNEKIEDRWERNNRTALTRSMGTRSIPRPAKVALWRRDVAGRVKIKAGDPDVYANTLIERQFLLWQQAQNCTIAKDASYQQTRSRRLAMTARDGNILVRKIPGADNDFRFAVQLIPADYLDLDMNLPASQTGNGNEIRMGVERVPSTGEKVAYWVIAQSNQNWLFASDYVIGGKHVRIPASEIVHSVRLSDPDATLSPPWITSVMSKLYQLDSYEEAEVRAAREAACKGGYIERTLPNDYTPDYVDSDGTPVDLVEPGTTKILNPGEVFKPYDPKHPNQNYPEFRKAILRSIAAGLRTSYNLLANDLEGVNYSSMRSGALDERENWMMIQKWDIETNEIPVFEAWLEAAMLCGRVPLPFAKFDKFNQPNFQGRRWKWVDPLKDAEGYSLLLKLGLITRTGIMAEQYASDFEDVISQLSIEEDFLTDAGLPSLTLAALNAVPAPVAPPSPEEGDDNPPKEPAKPAKKPDPKEED